MIIIMVHLPVQTLEEIFLLIYILWGGEVCSLENIFELDCVPE